MKDEIIKTRTGGLGSSDARMIARIGRNGFITETDKRRLAVMLGIENQKEFTSFDTEHGNFIEQKIFEYLQEKIPFVTSNPYTEYKSLSEQLGFKVFNHIDFEIITKDTLIWIECKDSKYDTDEVEKEYSCQLDYHFLIGQQKAIELGLDFVLSMYHYKDINKSDEFNPSFLKYRTFYFRETNHLIQGLEIISNEIKDFKYEKSEEFHISDLPDIWQSETESMQLLLEEIENKQKEVDDFKQRLLEIMEKNNVKSIKNDYFYITYVAPSVSVGFDKDKLKKELPEVFEKYNTKKSNKKSYLKLTIKK